MTSFEYGCSTTNKFSFGDSEDVEDPSEILAQMAIQTAAAKEQALKDAKKAAGAKKTTAGGKPTSAAKDGKKPLQQQQVDNAKSGAKTDDLKKDGRQAKPRTNGDRKPDGAPREGKENTSGREGGFGGQVRDQQRRPRPEGGFENRGGQDGARPPRRAPGTARPPRRTGEDGEWQGGSEWNSAEPKKEEGGEGGFRRSGGGAGGFRGPRREGGFQGERREGGFRGERREGGFRRNDPDHPRTFERHSGSDRTGVKAVDKKEGAGKSNWGTYNDELVAEGDAVQETSTGDVTTGDWATRVDENDEKKEGETTESGEAVPNFLTLAEYKALQNEITKKNEFNTRRAGEGEDQAKWKNTYVLPKKPAEDDEDEDEDEDEEEEELDEEELKKKELVKSIQIKFNEPASKDRNDRPRGDRPRGDRPPRRDADAAGAEEASPEKRRPQGAPRAQGGFQGGNRGPQQQHRPSKAAPRIEDEKDFPSLGAK